MKIDYVSATIVRIHLEHGEEMAPLMPVLSAFGDQVTVEIVIAPLDAEPVIEDDTPALFSTNGMSSAPGPEVPETPKPAPRRRPTSVYVTEEEDASVRLLRQHPEGLTAAQIGKVIGKPNNSTAVILWRLRTKRPSNDTTLPLVTKVSNGRHRVTALGSKINLKISGRPNYENRKLGWGES